MTPARSPVYHKQLLLMLTIIPQDKDSDNLEEVNERLQSTLRNPSADLECQTTSGGPEVERAKEKGIVEGLIATGRRR